MNSSAPIDTESLTRELARFGVEAVTIDDFIGGAIRLIQPREGYRASMDGVLLAASVPAKPGERVLEAGTGTGVAALCLAHRCPGAEVVGVEIQRTMAEVAQRNIALNQLGDRVSIVRACVTMPPATLPPQSFDHVFANPPYLEFDQAVAPPEGSKKLAHVNSTATLKDWVGFCLKMAKPRGTVSFVFRADRVDALLGLLYLRAGDVTLCPLWPRPGKAAKRILVQARKGASGASALLPGIALHGEGQRYSPEAEAVLRHGAAIDLAEDRRRLRA